MFHMVQRLYYAASRVGVLIKLLRVAYVSHMAQMLNDATLREDVTKMPRREDSV